MNNQTNTPPAERPTPETDAYIGDDQDCMTEGEIALCEFIRRLERERDNAISDFRQADTDSIRALHERNEARELIAVKDRSIAAANQTIMLNNELMRQATDKLAEVREHRDKLAEACRWAQSQLGKHTRPSPIDSALATLKGATNESR